jgi:large subunit ribosomal protein L22
MEAKAVARHVRMSPRKVRLVVDQIRGRSVNEAYALLQFSKKAASEPVGKTLRSAVANAQYKAQDQGDVLDVDELLIREAYVDEGPTLRRFRAAAMGRAAPIRKRTSHITVIVDSETSSGREERQDEE